MVPNSQTRVLEAYAFFDTKAGAYLPPYFANNLVNAMRQAEMVARDKQNPISMWVEDYALYKVGFFNEYDGQLQAIQPPEFVARMADMQKKEVKNG